MPSLLAAVVDASARAAAAPGRLAKRDAIAACLLAAGASLMRGGIYHHEGEVSGDPAARQSPLNADVLPEAIAGVSLGERQRTR